MRKKISKIDELPFQSNITDFNINVGELLLKFAQKSQDVFWIKNHDYSQQIYLSPSYQAIYGRDPKALINNSNLWINCVHPNDREKVKNSLNQRRPDANKSTSFFLTYRIITPENKIRWIKDESFPIHDNNGKHIAFAGIAQEITKEKELEIAKEEARIANNAKSEFLANVSHDLRTPLNWLLGAAEILKKNNANKEHDHLFEVLINGGNRIKNMVNSILDYSRLELKMPPLEKKPINLRMILEENIQMFKNPKNLTIILDYPEHCPSSFLGDKYVLLRIFNNLLDNAFKFTHSGYILIKISKLENTKEKNTTTLQICIEDSGIGIPKDKLNIIFNKFEKVEPSYKNSYHGIGLGLTIIQKFVTAMNGSIITKSKPYQGSQFILKIPFTNQKSNKYYPRRSAFIKLKILIIDNIKQRARAYENSLEQHEVTSISSNKTGELTKKKFCYNLIIIDNELLSQRNNALLSYSLLHKEQKKLILILHKKNQIHSMESHFIKQKNIKHLFIKPILPTMLNHLFYTQWLNWQINEDGRTNTIKKLKSKVLLVEDQLLAQKITCYYLANEFNCHVDQATTAISALSYVAKKKYDLIFMDIGLPDACGIKTAKKIHEYIAKMNHNTPIIALTAHASLQDKQACYEAGMVDFISKPISMNDLKQALYQHLLY